MLRSPAEPSEPRRARALARASSCTYRYRQPADARKRHSLWLSLESDGSSNISCCIAIAAEVLPPKAKMAMSALPECEKLAATI
jgi:hypothetical protein